ncbi:MAG: PepSY domain-containing protein [Woeseia sp.]
MKSFANILLLVVALGSGFQAMAGKFEIGDLLKQVEEVTVSDSDEDRKLLVAQSNGRTLSEAVEIVKRRYKGRIVSAETKLRGNREVHHIKVLTEDGKVKTVEIQGRTRRP